MPDQEDVPVDRGPPIRESSDPRLSVGDATPGYVAQSADTSVEADRVQFEIYRSWSATAKLEAMADLWRTARNLSLAGLRLRHPGASEEELELREAALRLGDDLARKVYGERYSRLLP